MSKFIKKYYLTILLLVTIIILAVYLSHRDPPLNQNVDNTGNAVSGLSATGHGVVNAEIQQIKNSRGQGAFITKNLFTKSQNAAVSAHVPKNKGTVLKMEGRGAKIIAEQPDLMNVDIPLSDTETANLDLYKVTNTVNVKTSTGGDSMVKHVSYRGIIHGDPSSLASIDISPDGKEVNGFVWGGNGKAFTISKVKNTDVPHGKESEDQVVVIALDGIVDTWTDEELTIPGAAGFNNQENESKISSLFAPKAEAAATYSVKMRLDTDYDIYVNRGSSVSNVQNSVLGTFAQVQTLYVNDGMAVELKTLNIWNTPDPFTGPSANNYLTQYGNYVLGIPNFFPSQGDAAQLLGMNGGGVTWMAVLEATNPSVKTSYAGIRLDPYATYPAYSWPVDVMAHEIGHLIGSIHTHECNWNGNGTAIDGCQVPVGCADPKLPEGGGTIMSYCHTTSVGKNFSKGFGAQPVQLMQYYINHAGQMGKLTAPSGGTVTPPPPPPTSDTVPPSIPTGITFPNVTTASVTISWGASTDNVGVVGYEIIKNGTSLASQTATSYTAAGLAASTKYSFIIKAKDAAGNVAESSAFSVTTLSNAPMTVSLASPLANTYVASSVTLSTNINGGTSGIKKVEFYRGTTLLNTDTTSPYSYSWPVGGVANGAYSLIAKVYDNGTAAVSSAPVTIIVDHTKPTMSFASGTPAAGMISGTVALNVSASDTNLQSVEFLDGTTSLVVDTTAPYSYSWNTTAVLNGSHTITVRAKDKAGNTTTTIRTFTVSNAAADTVSSPPPTGDSGSMADNFTRTDSLSPGGSWIELSGSWSILSNELRNAAGLSTPQILLATSSAGSVNQSISASFAYTATSTSTKLGLVVREQNSSNYYACYRINGGSSTRRIVKVVNGVETILGSSNLSNPTANSYFDLSCAVNGSTITMGAGGTTILTVNDSTFTSGSLGILASGSSAPSHRFDNVNALW